jgi:hypothetical protein
VLSRPTRERTRRIWYHGKNIRQRRKSLLTLQYCILRLIPNEPPKHSESVEETEPGAQKEPRETPKGATPVNQKVNPAFSDSAPNSPADGRKAQKATKLFAENSGEEPKNNYGGKLWRMLFGNMTRSLDDLYGHCEEQDDKAKCQEVVDLLARSRSDFKKLTARLEVQSKFEPGQAMAWEIRKPTLPSPMNPVSNLLVADNEGIDNAAGSANASPVARAAQPESPSGAVVLKPSADETAPLSISTPASAFLPSASRKLNPGAKPFNPVSAFPVLNTPVVTAKKGSPQTSAAAPPKAERSVPDAVLSNTSPRVTARISPRVGTGLHTRSASPPTLELPSRVTVPLSTAFPASVAASTQTSATAPTPSLGYTAQMAQPPPGLSTRSNQRTTSTASTSGVARKDEWSDERLQIDLQQASEQVWAAAEAWVEAEAEAEEQEWQLLQLGIDSFLIRLGLHRPVVDAFAAFRSADIAIPLEPCAMLIATRVVPRIPP